MTPYAQSELAAMNEPQTRGYFMNLVRTLSPVSLELELHRAAEAGFNVVLFPVYNNGWTLFPSQAITQYKIPRINPLFKRWDPLAEVCRVARQAGMSVWTFARLYNFHPRYSIAEHRLLKKHPTWRLKSHPEATALQRRRENWYPCPINPEYRRFLGDMLTEMVAAYPVDAIVMSFTGLGLEGGTLEEWPYCFCTQCRQRYADSRDGADLAADALDEARFAGVRAWQLDQVHQNLSYLRHRLMRTQRSLGVMCRTRSPWRDQPAYRHPLHDGGPLVDWVRLLNEGSIEALMVDHEGEQTGPWLGSRLAADYAFLGEHVFSIPIVSINALDELRWPVEAAARYPIPGFIVEFEHQFSAQEAQYIRQTYFPQPADSTNIIPIRTAIYLLDRVRRTHEDIPRLHDLMTDMLRLLLRQLTQPADFTLLQVIEENLLGLEEHMRRGRLGRNVPEATMRDLGLARRFVRMASMDTRS